VSRSRHRKPSRRASVHRKPSRHASVHRKPSRHASARRDSSGERSAHARHEEQPPAAAKPRGKRVRTAAAKPRGRRVRTAAAKPRGKRVRIAAAVAGSAVLILAAVVILGAAAVAHRHGLRAHSAALYQASARTTRAAGGGLGTATSSRPASAGKAAQGAAARGEKQRLPQPLPTTASGYRNPLRAVSDLVMKRVDQGVDFGGAGPVYALGDGIITNAMTGNAGWPGGGWITYRLTDGPDTGLTVYLAEDVTPTVQAGQTVTSSTVIANMFSGGHGIETGWATSAGSTAESQPRAGGGPLPTIVGLNFAAVLEGLGVPAARGAA
jgi:hypothetical protein